MKRIQGLLVGAVAGVAMMAFAAVTHAQDTDPATGQSSVGTGSQPTLQYCVPGCIVAPMEGNDMHHGTMDQGMMNHGMMPMMMAPGMTNQGMMPMMMAPGMMNQGMMPMMGYGMTNQGMMPMMGYGMMNQGMMPMMGQGMMSPGMMPMMGATVAAPLAPDDVRSHLEHHLTMMGMPNLVLGSIEERDDDTLVAEIVTKDGTLVQRLAIDRHTGAVEPLE